MRFGDVDFPKELIDAQSKGELVIFAGAGVSMGPPSNLPSFEALVDEIAVGALPRADTEPLERYLGRLAKENQVPVHEIAKSILTRKTSRPGRIHRDLLRIFQGVESLRLVTTNFDSHFENPAKKIFGKALVVYRAPALPVGHDFSGIVNVHGSVHGEEARMVLTDEDFGRAYLTEGWARRFLNGLFANFTVLFVGYSHQDTVVGYLARGLPPSAKPRFALIPEWDSENKHWFEYLGVTTFVYPRGKGTRGDHAPFHHSIHQWAQETTRGALEKERRIQSLVGNRPSFLTGEEESLLEQAVRDDRDVQFFNRHARDPEWLAWLDRNKVLDPLFKRGVLSSPHGVIAQWIATHFAINHAEEVFELLAGHGRNINETLAWLVTHELCHKRNNPSSEVLSKWVAVMVSDRDFKPDGLGLTYLISRCMELDAFAAAVELFDRLTRPRLALERRWRSSFFGEEDEPKTGVEVVLAGDFHLVSDCWPKDFLPRLGDVAGILWPIVCRNLEQTYTLQKAAGTAEPDWDAVSFHRSAIEPHEQDKYPYPWDLLINAARDLLQWALENNEMLADSWLKMLETAEAPILRRLAIHGIRLKK